MIAPNSDCAAFTNWLLHISWQPLSGPQRALVIIVDTAAQTAGVVTNQQWFNFNKFTAWRYPYFKVYNDLAAVVPVSLLTDITRAYSFEGDYVDQVGAQNGAGIGTSFASPAGSLGQSAQFNGSTSNITIPTLSPGAAISIALRVYKDSSLAVTAGLFSGSPYTVRPRIVTGTNKILVVCDTTNAESAPITLDAWHDVVITWDGSIVSIFVDGALSGTTGIQSAWDDMDTIGYDAFSAFFFKYMNYFYTWDRVLNAGEITTLYNGGTGLKYPF